MRIVTDAASNMKTRQRREGKRAVILHLAPADTAGYGSVCPWAGRCKLPCLNTSGQGQVIGEIVRETLEKYSTHRTRIERTRRFMRDRAGFLADLNADLANLTRRAKRDGLLPVARLNGTSDIPWEAFGIPQAHPDVVFYDYTKGIARAMAFAEGRLPANYHVTWSFDGFGPVHPRNRAAGFETNEDATVALLRRGVNVAVVFERLPETFLGFPVIDGTKDDWRFEDPPGVVVGLLPKGRAKKDSSGFVIRTT